MLRADVFCIKCNLHVFTFKIGEYFGKRDHTTVMYACDRIRTVIAADDSVKQVVELLTAQLDNT